jgi:hypothetical protein
VCREAGKVFNAQSRKEMVRGDAQAIPHVTLLTHTRRVSKPLYVPFSCRISPGVVAHAAVTIGQGNALFAIIPFSICTKFSITIVASQLSKVKLRVALSFPTNACIHEF